MWKTFKTVLWAATALLVAVSCRESAETTPTEETNKSTIDIRVSGLMGEYAQVDGTRATLVNTIRVSWEGGETIYVYDGTQYLGSLKASLNGNDDSYAILSTDATHTVKAPAQGTTQLTLVYSPLLTEAPAVSEGGLSISLAKQDGKKPPFVAYATLAFTGTTITNAVVPFKFATSVVKVDCIGLAPNTAISSAILNNVNTTCRLALSATAAPTVTGTTNGLITRTGDAYFDVSEINEEGEAVFQLAVPALELTTKNRVMTIKQGSVISKDRRFTKNALKAATSVNTVCQMIKLKPYMLPGEFSVSDNKSVQFTAGNLYWDGSVFKFEDNQYDFISYWNDRHVGHFFWTNNADLAVLEQYQEFKKTDKDVFFTNAQETTANPQFTVNNVTGVFRTLSKDEWVHLLRVRTVNSGKGLNHSYSVNINYGGFNGFVLYPDDYSGPMLSATVDELPEGVVFLPLAGQRRDNRMYRTEDKGFYWASTVFNDPIDDAYVILQYSNEVIPSYISSRSEGCCVRLVAD